MRQIVSHPRRANDAGDPPRSAMVRTGRARAGLRAMETVAEVASLALFVAMVAAWASVVS